MASRYDDELWQLVPEGRRAAPEIVDWVASLEPARRAALDLGCGDGAVSQAIPLARGSRAAEGARADEPALVLADVSAVALARARVRLPAAEVVELEPDAPLPFDDGRFDLVVCTETLEHVRDVQMLLSETRRVLAPHGRLAITTPAHGALIRPPEPLTPHLRFFTKRSLTALLDHMGFEVQHLARRDGGLYALATR